MNITAILHVTDHPSRGYVASDAALEAVRFSFNPSLNEEVTRLKALAALFLTECDAIAARNPEAAGEVREAKILARSASMWAVLAATKAA
jgi:hypothetical protein